MKVILTVEKLESKPNVFPKCEWDKKGERIEVVSTGWQPLADYIQNDFLSEWNQKKYCRADRFRTRLREGLDFLEKELKLACYTNRSKAEGNSSKNNQFELINLPEVSVDIDTCLRLFDRKYKEFQKRQKSNKTYKQKRKKASKSSSDKSPSTIQKPNAVINPFGITLQKNPFFTGRESVIKQIHEQLHPAGASKIIRIQAISGLGGTGKTQTAVEYAYRNYFDEKTYEYVFWVNADTESNLKTNFADLTHQLALPLVKEEIEEKIRTIRTWLDTHNNWLLIFDNADEPALLSSIIPSNPKGKVLVTSRASSFASIGIKNPINLDVLSSDESVEFLFERTNCDDTNTEKQAATELAQELGYLPLALEQAGAFILKRGKSFQEYLHSYQKRGLTFLEKSKAQTGEYPTSLQKTWVINFEAVAEDNPASSELLKLSSFLAPDNIPYDILMKGASHLGDILKDNLQADDNDDALLAVEDLLEPLSQYSLIKWESAQRFYSVHRMVQAVMRDGIEQATRNIWIERIIITLVAAYPGSDFSHRFSNANLLPHWLAIINQATHASIKSIALGRLFNNAGSFLSSQGRFNEAESLYKEAVSLRKELLGEKHSDVARSLYQLASVYGQNSLYREAEKIYQEALSIWKKNLGEAHPYVVTTLYSLASVHFNLGHYKEAESTCQMILTLFKESSGEKPVPETLVISALASIYKAQGRYSEAESAFKEAITEWESLYGDKENPEFAKVLSSLLELYLIQDRYNEAESIAKQNLALRKRLFDQEHPHIAISLDDLALVYNMQGRYNEAEPLHVEAIAMYQKLLGEEHSLIAKALMNCASTYEAQGRYNEAKQLYQKALKIQQNIYNGKHTNLAFAYDKLAGLCIRQGNYSEGDQLYQKALAIRKLLLGEEHYTIATNLNNLAKSYSRQDRYDEAEQLYKEALIIQQKSFGKNHSSVATSMVGLAAIYIGTLRYKDAESLCQEALEIQKSLLGEEHPSVITTLNNFASACFKQGHQRYPQAELLYKKALEIHRKLLGVSHDSIVSTLKNMALLFYYQGRFTEAEPLYKEALVQLRAFFDWKHPNLIDTVHQLGHLYYAQGNYIQAEPFLLEALEIQQRISGKKSPNVIFYLNNLAYFYCHQERFSDAEPLLREVLSLRAEYLGPEHSRTQLVRTNLQILLKKKQSNCS